MKAAFLGAGLPTAAALLSKGLNILVGLNVSAGLNLPSPTVECKCAPGDACWPSSGDWDSLNQTVSGRLIATIPLAHACHNPNYDSAECQVLRNSWQNPAIQ